MALPAVENVLRRWCAGLEEFVTAYHLRFGETVDPFAWWERNPAKARAFFAPDTLSLSPEMKVAVWRILLNSFIDVVEVVFRPEEHLSQVRLVLSTPYGEKHEFRSETPEDLRLLRHLGVLRVDGRLELQGYYAFAQATGGEIGDASLTTGGTSS